MDYHIEVPFAPEELEKIKPMDMLYLTGTIYTARDAAHKRMYETILKELGGKYDPSAVDTVIGEEDKDRVLSLLPFDIRGSIIYYLGPTPARPGQVIGSAGPTTSGRMDKYTPMLLELGLKGMIGKGRRSQAVIDSIQRNHAIYMGATGGAGALLSKCIKSSEIIAYEDLGTEAIRKLYVENFPVTVLIG